MLDKLIDLSLKYRLLVIVLFISICALGFRAYKNIPVDAFPDITPKQVVIIMKTIQKGVAYSYLSLFLNKRIPIIYNKAVNIPNIIKSQTGQKRYTQPHDIMFCILKAKQRNVKVFDHLQSMSSIWLATTKLDGCL